MKKIGLFLLLGVSFSWLVSACQGCQQERRKEVPLDSIVLSDPCIFGRQEDGYVLYDRNRRYALEKQGFETLGRTVPCGKD